MKGHGGRGVQFKKVKVGTCCNTCNTTGEGGGGKGACSGVYSVMGELVFENAPFVVLLFFPSSPGEARKFRRAAFVQLKNPGGRKRRCVC